MVWTSGKVILKQEGVSCLSNGIIFVMSNSLRSLEVQTSRRQSGLHGVEMEKQGSYHSCSYQKGLHGVGTRPGFLTHLIPGQPRPLISAVLNGVQLWDYLLCTITSPWNSPFLHILMMPITFSNLFHYKHKPLLLIFVFLQLDSGRDMFQLFCKSFQTNWSIHRQAQSLFQSPASQFISIVIKRDSLQGFMLGTFSGAPCISKLQQW